MRWLIDGYNVIRRDSDLRARETDGLAAGRGALLRRLAAVAGDRGEIFVVVFDGARLRADDVDASAAMAGRVEIVFSRAPETADDILRRLAERWRDAAVVVSSDRAVETAARRAGAVAVTTEDFLRALDRSTAATAPDKGDDDDEDDEDSGPRSKRGNPRRVSRDERASRRVLRRLSG